MEKRRSKYESSCIKRIYNQIKDKRNHPIGLQADGIEKFENTAEARKRSHPKKRRKC